MEEELITFTTAKLAKKKGFIAHCNGMRYELKTEKIKSFGNDDGAAGEYMNGHNFIDAPTQSLLQKWLREGHDSYIMIMCSHDNFNYINLTKADIVTIDDGDYSFQDYMENLDYNSYEEALEAGLLEALKLIK